MQALLSMKPREQPDRFVLMAGDDAAIAKRIKQLRTDQGLTQDQFAKRLGGVTRGAVGNWERGEGIKRDNLATIARQFEVSFDWLATGAGSYSSALGPVVALPAERPKYAGTVQAGEFLPVDEYFNQDPEQVPEFVTNYPAFRKARQYAWRARGDSMNQAGIHDGMWVIGADAADYIDLYGDIESGEFVVVERTRYQGSERELTVKEIRYYRDRYELHPQSSNPEHKPIVVPHDHTVDGDGMEVKVIGVVLAVTADMRRRR
jgi:SOS-response transcriptional repressor LexA